MIAFIVAILIVIYVFAKIIVNYMFLLINIPILWAILVRLRYNLGKNKVLIPYLIGLFVTTILYIFLFDFIQIPYIFWPILFLAIMMIIGELIHFATKENKKEKIVKRTKTKLKHIP